MSSGPNQSGASQRLLRVQEQERGRLAREIHDQLGTLLALQRAHIEHAAEMLRTAAPDAAAEELAEAARLADRLTETVRDIHVALRPESLDDLGLAAAAQSLRHVFGRAGLDVALETTGIKGRRFGTDVETTAFRVLQHALTNVLRHSGVRSAKATLEIVDVRGRRLLRVTTEDAGKGFAPKSTDRRAGISAMQDRIALVGGTMVLDAAPGRGTRVTADLPIGVERP